MDATPKSKRYRGPKGCKKKRLLTDHKAEPEDSGKCPNPPPVPFSEVTPPRRTRCKEKEDTKRVEWEYHGRFNDTDVVVWGSPQGSPNIGPVRIIEESPIPRQNVPEEDNRIIERNESCEPPQFVSEILALSEKIKATKSDESSELSEVDTCGEEKTAFNESYSKLFDEEMNEFMIQCSQEVEETILKNTESETNNMKAATKLCDNKKKVLSEFNIKSATLQRPENSKMKWDSSDSELKSTEEKTNISRGGGTSARELLPGKRQTSCLKEKSYQVVNKCSSADNKSGTRYFYRGLELCVPNSHVKASTTSSTYPIKVQEADQKSVVESKVSTSKCNSKTAVKSIKTIMDSSFDAVKESFLEDGLDLLITVPDVPDVSLASVCLPDSRNKALLSTNPPFSHKQPVVCETNTNSGLDDSTFFEDNVLQYLDSLESTVSNSQPIRCTPEEIEKKRKEAKLKLEKKTKR